MKTTKHLPVMGVVILFIACILPAPLTAQTSRISENTVALFSNDIDAFMDPNDYGTVEFKNFFGTVLYDADLSSSYRTLNVDTNILSAGLAINSGSSYLGFLYSGAIYEYNQNVNLESSYNSFHVLVGSSSFGGIKAGLTLQSQYAYNDFFIAFSIDAGWGKNFSFANGSTFKPELNVSFIYPGNDPDASEFVAGYNIDPRDYGYEANYLIDLALEADWVLAPGNGAERSLTFGYALAIANILESHSLGHESFTMYFHSLQAYYKQTHVLSGQFSFAWRLGAELAYSTCSYSYNEMVLISGSFARSVFDFAPVGAVGFIYKFNSPFSLNAALGLSYPINSTKESSTYLGGSSTSTSVTTYSGLTVTTSAGGSFDPHPNVGIDFSWNNPNYYKSSLGTFKLALRFKK